MMLIFTKACQKVALFQIFIATPAIGLPSLFRIDSVHQIVSSLSHACGSINTKSMDALLILLATGSSAGNCYTFFIECFDFDIMFLIELVAIRLVCQWCFQIYIVTF
jgi:hypothetical protein